LPIDACLAGLEDGLDLFDLPFLRGANEVIGAVIIGPANTRAYGKTEVSRSTSTVTNAVSNTNSVGLLPIPTVIKTRDSKTPKTQLVTSYSLSPVRIYSKRWLPKLYPASYNLGAGY